MNIGDFPVGPIYILGTNLADTLTGTTAGDVLMGFGGNDMLSGGDGADTIDGGSGTNRVDGGAGNDLIVIDRTATNGLMMTPATGIVGGDGYDTVSFAGTMAEFHVVNTVGFGLTITDLVGAARTIAVGVEHLKFTDGDIWLVDPNLSAPVVSGVVTASAVEDGLPVSVDLLALASDPDPNSALSVTGLGVLPAGFSVSGSVVTLDPGAFQYLGQGVTEVVTLAYQVSDGLNLVDAFAQVTVTGENDAALFSGVTGAVGEEGGMASGAVVVTDVDAGEAGLVTDGVFAGAFGVFAVTGGAWSYRVDADALPVQGMSTGQVLEDRLDLTSTDGTAGALIVSITGVTDALVLGGIAGDRINGRGAAERIYSAEGADTVQGNGGADTIDGGAGADRLLGGDGADRIIWDAADLMADGEGGYDTLVVKNAATVTLSAFDQVAGDAGRTRGFEAVDAGLSLGSVSLTGSDAANRLIGGYADDMLAGGRGADVLTGGMGADSFVFGLRGGVDHVTDFAVAEDHLVISGRTAAQVSWTEVGADTRVDLGGTVVFLDGVQGLALSDFLFI